MAKVEVHLWSGLRAAADGKEMVEIEASTVGEVLKGLVAAHPGLQGAIDAGVSVAVDGRIIATGLTEPVHADSEVYLMQRLKGGRSPGFALRRSPKAKRRKVGSRMRPVTIFKLSLRAFPCSDRPEQS